MQLILNGGDGMIVGIDIDGTLLDILSVCLDEYNRVSGESVKSSDIKEYYWHKNLDQNHKPDQLRQPHLYQFVRPVEGAVEAVKKIQQNHTIVVISHDRKEFAEIKGRIIRRWFGLNDIVFAEDKRCVKYDLLIDDAPHNHPDILLEQSYNNIPQGSWIYRMPWEPIPYLLERAILVRSIRDEICRHNHLQRRDQNRVDKYNTTPEESIQSWYSDVVSKS